ncbi:hypothetical protein ANO14919_051780 [Xylariales sp. No.14919]|nr:hypothetical protein ANO14919_051780 [Xylariales sp. No.14919]
MRTNILLSLSITVGAAFAYDTCLTESSWNDCVSTRRDAALSKCLSASTLPLSLATPLIASCDCNGFDINYS